MCYSRPVYVANPVVLGPISKLSIISAMTERLSGTAWYYPSEVIIYITIFITTFLQNLKTGCWYNFTCFTIYWSTTGEPGFTDVCCELREIDVQALYYSVFLFHVMCSSRMLVIIALHNVLSFVSLIKFCPFGIFHNSCSANHLPKNS